MGSSKDDVNAIQVENSAMEPRSTDISHNEMQIAEKTYDGDEALRILHTHFEPYTAEEEKRVLRKIDLHMVLLMLVINGLQFVDKNTISAAATYGIIKEAQLVGQEFSLLITIFYIGYLVAQYPTNLLMQRYPTGKYLTINFVLWGVTLAAMSSARTFATLATARFFLGVFESCLNPGFVLITSSWWKREEQVARVGIWYSANGLMGAPSGLVFWGIAHIHAKGWFPYQWMFLFLGVFTVIFGISLWWILPDSPLSASFLTERERLIAVERLKSNKTGVKNVHHKKPQVKEALRDPRVWMLVFAVFWHNMTNSLQSNFTGLIIRGFGYSTYQAVLLSIPGGIIFAVVMIIVSCFLSTKWGEGKRIILILLLYIPGIISCALLYTIRIAPSTRGVHLYAVFTLPIVACSAGITYSLLAANIAGYTKKTVAGSLFFSAYCLANIISPQTFLASQAPFYHTGVAVTLAAFAINMVLFASLYVIYRRANAKRDREGDNAEVDATDDLINAFSDLTDLENKKMRYKL